MFQAAEVARVAQNRAAAVAAAVRDAAGGGAGGAALLQNGVGVAPAENNNNPIDPERLQVTSPNFNFRGKALVCLLSSIQKLGAPSLVVGILCATGRRRRLID